MSLPQLVEFQFCESGLGLRLCLLGILYGSEAFWES
jgi:hypothetical protein